MSKWEVASVGQITLKFWRSEGGLPRLPDTQGGSLRLLLGPQSAALRHASLSPPCTQSRVRQSGLPGSP